MGSIKDNHTLMNTIGPETTTIPPVDSEYPNYKNE